MLIRRQIILGSGLAILAVVAAVGYLLWVQAESRRFNAVADAASRISREVAGKLAAAHDLGTVHSERAQRQWATRHETIGRLLDAMPEATPKIAGSVARLRDSHHRIGRLFERAADTSFVPDSVEYRLQTSVIVGRILAEAQLMAEEAFRLRELAHARAKSSQRASQWATIVVLALLATLVLGGSLITFGRLLRPLGALDTAARHAARGEYARARVDIDRGDEFGRAATAFNRMVATIDERERALERSVKALEQRNEELDEFAYVASHDLKAPLNAIEQLAEWIAQDNERTLPTESLDHLRLMQSRTARLKGLLADMLTYARAGRTDTDVEEIDVAVTARHLFDLLVAEGFELTVARTTGPVLLPRIPFEQVLRNLFSNAIKHHDRGHGRIDLSMERVVAGWRFTVTDDGPGIDPAYHERIFGMFQTLRSRDEREGSGMGLALVRKLVRYYGGSIGIESDGTRGTTVWFTWPKQAGDRGRTQP